MKDRFRMFLWKKRNAYYVQDNTTKEQKSLGTSDKKEAARLLHAMNESHKNPSIGTQMACASMLSSDANFRPELGRLFWMR